MRRYRAVLKPRSGNIYIVNIDDIYNDFYAFNGDPKHLDFKRLYTLDELIIDGSFAKICSDSFAFSAK